MATRKKPAETQAGEDPKLPAPVRLSFAGTTPDKETAVQRAEQLIQDTGNAHFWFKRNDHMFEIFADCG